MKRVNEIEWASWQPQVRATLLFVIKEGQVLLIHKKRGLGQGKVNGPGGKIEAGRRRPSALYARPKRRSACGQR